MYIVYFLSEKEAEAAKEAKEAKEDGECRRVQKVVTEYNAFLCVDPVVITVGPSSSEPLSMIPGIECPAHIATGSNGEVVVAGFKDHKVYVYNKEYQLVRTIGSTGFLDGQFMCPSGIAVDSRNRIFVSSMSKVDVFTMEGQFVTAAGSQGKGPLQFTGANAIALSKTGKIYVADAQNNRIQILNNDLTYCDSFSEASKTVGSGRLNQPHAIAINSEGKLYVADMMNHTIQVFTPEGGFLFKFGKYGQANTPGAITSPTSIAIDREDNVYVGVATGSVAIFSKEGNFLRQFGSYGSELGQFSYIRGLHIDRKGQLFVSEWTSNRIQIFPGSLSMVGHEEETESCAEVCEDTVLAPSKPADVIGPTSSQPIKVISDICQPEKVTEGKNGEVIVSSWKDHKVYIYSPENNYQLAREIGGEGYGDGKFTYPSGIAVTADNLLLVSSYYKLQWFTMEGELVHAIGQRHDSGKGKEKSFGILSDASISKDGIIYFIDSSNKRVNILNSDATFHHSFEFPLLDAEKDQVPSGLAVNSEGNLYFADQSNNCVRVLSSLGEPLFKFGKSGNWMERGVLLSPMAVAIDSEDNVFVASVFMVSIFDKSGSFLRSFGGHGDEPGQFNFIKGLYVSKNGYIYVTDHSNNCVQIFETSKPSQSNGVASTSDIKMCRFPRPIHSIGPKSVNPVQVISAVADPVGVTTALNGDIMIADKKTKRLIDFSCSDFEQQGEVSRLSSESSRNIEMVDLKDVAVCEDGCFLVVIRHQVLKILPSGEVVGVIGSQGKSGGSNSELNSPTSVAVGDAGQVYVVDSGNQRIQVFNADLSYKSSGFPEGSQAMKKVAINSKGTVYVTDEKNGCVHVFNKEGVFLFSFANLSSPVAIAIDHKDYIYIGTSQECLIFAQDGHFKRAFGKRGNKPGEFRNIRAMHIDTSRNLYICDGNSHTQIFTGLTPPWSANGEASEEENLLLPEIVLNDVKEPCGIAGGRNGEVVIASSSNHKVFVYDSHGQLVSEFGEKGILDGQFICPISVAVTSDNLILTSCRNTLQWFTMAGQLVYSVGGSGKEVLEFDYTVSVALGHDDRIYVLEKGNKRVQVLKGDAKFLSSFEIPKDQFPEALSVNSEGKVFMVDTRNSCIQVFSSKGVYLSKFCVKDSEEPLLPTAVAVDLEDNIYIGDARGIISVFDKEGIFIRALQGRGDAPDDYSVIKGLYVSQRGHVYVSNCSTNQVLIFKELDSFEPCTADVWNTSSSPVLPYRPLHTIGPKSVLPVRVIDDIQEPNGVTTDEYGKVYVSSNKANKILVFNPGDCKVSFEIAKISNPQDPKFKGLSKPCGLAVTDNDCLLVSFQHQLVKMDLSGKALAFVGGERNRKGSNDSELNDPGGIAFGTSSQIFLVDRGNHRIQIFNNDFTLVTSLSNPDTKKSRYEYLERVAVNSAGEIYVTDRRNCNVQVYDRNGKYLFEFGTEAKAKQYKRGGLSHPHAIAIDKEDFVFVGDENGVVSIFDKKGVFMRSFGGPGDQLGSFGNIQAMHFDCRGMLYVCEWKTNRVQIFQGQ